MRERDREINMKTLKRFKRKKSLVTALFNIERGAIAIREW